MTKPPLTRKADVLKVLQLGGYAVVPAEPTSAPGLVYLFDTTGTEVHAWQTAIRSNLDKCIPGVEVVTAAGVCREWRIKS